MKTQENDAAALAAVRALQPLARRNRLPATLGMLPGDALAALDRLEAAGILGHTGHGGYARYHVLTNQTLSDRAALEAATRLRVYFANPDAIGFDLATGRVSLPLEVLERLLKSQPVPADTTDRGDPEP